jgi:predicted Zn-dependent protease
VDDGVSPKSGDLIVAKTFIEAIGHSLGRKAAQAKNAFDLMGGSEEESLRAEIRLGRDLATAVVERTPLLHENETTRFTAQILHWLSAHVKEKKLPFSVRVTAERYVNAFSLPGGPIFVSWGLLAICAGERDEIAFLLGHEIGHIVRRHALDRLIKDAAISLLLRKSSGRGAASAWLNQVGRQELNRGYSRDDEFEADGFSASLLRTAGGDAAAAERVIQKLAQQISGEGQAIAGDYFVAHPPASERIANLRATSRPGPGAA